MATTLSTNMNLPIPGVGNEAGPDYAEDINNCLTILDGHTHVSGSGVPITPSAMNINSELTFGNFPITNAQSLGMYLQTGDPTALGCLYYKGVDLYFNDGSSNHIRITASGSVTGATGTITGLPTGTASASYQSGSSTFVFQSATSTAANIDGRSFILRNSAASSHSLTLSPPAAMGSDIAQTLPSIPATTLVMTMDSGGAMGTVANASLGDTLAAAMTSTGANAISATRTRPVSTTAAVAGGILTTTSFSYTNATTGETQIASGDITTTGKPIRIKFVQHATPGTASSVGVSQLTATTDVSCVFILKTNAVVAGTIALELTDGNSAARAIIYPPGVVEFYQDLAAGTYTISVWGKCLNANNQMQAIGRMMVIEES